MAAKRWLVLVVVVIAVALTGATEAGTAPGEWALILGAAAVGALVSASMAWLFWRHATPRPPRPLGRWGTLLMLAGIGSVAFWEDSDAAPLVLAAGAGFVVATVLYLWKWPTS